MSGEGANSQVRRIAILVTSLDASAGRQLLMAMPTELARAVRRAMTQLSNVDPDEQRQILAEFRMQAMLASGDEGTQGNVAAVEEKTVVEKTGRDKRDDGETSGAGGDKGREPGLAPFGLGKTEPGLAAFGLGTLAELLRGERATVVAVVLNQLEPAAAAELLGSLPKAVQREVIVSFPHLGQIDPEAMAAIHEHLASRIADYHQRQAGESQSTSRLQELLAAASPELRSDWQNTFYQAEPQLAARMGIAAPVTSREQNSQAQTLNEPVVRANTSAQDSEDHAVDSLKNRATKPMKQRPAAPGASMLDLLANNVVTTADLPVAKMPESLQRVAATRGENDEAFNDRARILPFPTRRSDGGVMRFEQLLDLPAEVIGQVLASAETEVILYALAGASPAFMKRFMAMLDRGDRRALEIRLKQLRAINLKDVDAAQRRICELAGEGREVKVA